MKLINLAYALASIVLLIGVYFKLNDNGLSSTLVFSGMSTGITTAIIHYLLLLKQIENLEKREELEEV